MIRKSIRPLLGLFIVGTAAILFFATPGRGEFRTRAAKIDAYIALQQEALDTLRASFANPHPKVLVLPNDQPDEFSWPQALKDHTRHVLIHRQWDGDSRMKYLVTLTLKDDVDFTNEGNSNTMTATAILNHYFRPLEKIGFANRSTPMVAMSSIEYSAGEWIPKEEYTKAREGGHLAWVEGEVFVAPQEKQVVVRITVGGRFSE